jgi:uncharacterized protein
MGLTVLGTSGIQAYLPRELGQQSAAPNQKIVSTVAGLPGGLMYATQVDQDIACRTVGRCAYGAPLDREVMDLVPRNRQDGMTLEEAYAAPTTPLAQDLGRRFLLIPLA